MSRTVETLDEKALAVYLQEHVPGFRGPVHAEKFEQGQSNPTFLLSAASGHYVLRRKPPGQLLKSAHAVDREYRVIDALADTDVPVPSALHLCVDDAVIGSMFYIMSYERGRIFWDPSLPELEPTERRTIHEELVRVLAALHDVNVPEVGLGDFGHAGAYFARQIGRWTKQYRAAQTSTIAAMEKLLEWLPEHLPASEDSVSLIHGDYRIDNVIFHPTEPRAVAVLDWELSTLGHPLADLAYYCMCQRLPRNNGVRGLLGLDLNSLNIPVEKEIVATYCRQRQIAAIDPQHWHFYLAFSFFRLASICQGVYKRSLDGNASNRKAVMMGRAVEPLAQAGVALTAAA